MESLRKPLQGVRNIIWFNWHFYALAGTLLIAALCIAPWLGKNLQLYIYIIFGIIFIPVFVSLLVSFYVYDLSGLYNFNWMKHSAAADKHIIININAGFDETSAVIQHKFPGAVFSVIDFYDPAKHTEVSIKRARNAYPPFAGTQQVQTDKLPFANNTASQVYIIFAAHEIRQPAERIRFFKELKRVLQPGGQVYVMEHLRDLPNFLAYNIGCLHFYSKRNWLRTFSEAGLTVQQHLKHTPFISTFILTAHATAS